MNYDQQLANAEFAEYRSAAEIALKRLQQHVAQAVEGDEPASGYAPLAEILEHLDIEHWIQRGGMDSRSFESFLQRYLEYSVQLHNPRYIAHQVSVPDYPGALAALVNGVTNNPMAIYEMGPAAATIEYSVINWMLDKLGWVGQPIGRVDPSTHSAGVLTHGGSLANLTALLAARARIAPEAWESGCPNDLAVLVPPASHYSVARSVCILGLGAQSIYHLDVDRYGVIDPARLADKLAQIKADGRRCMALVANVCATATGLHDPLPEIGQFCRDQSIWLHADACHGATALLAPQSRHYLNGINLADSVVWDTHKMMQVPALCAAVLLRDAADFDRAFHQQASYLAYGRDSDAYDSLPRAIECTKAALGLKVFLTLAWRGEQHLGQYVDDRYQAAKAFYQQIEARPGFECLCEPQSNILCFRYQAGSDQQQQLIRDQLLQRKQFHLTSATVDGITWLRITVMNKLTDADTIEAMLVAIEKLAATLTPE